MAAAVLEPLTIALGKRISHADEPYAASHLSCDAGGTNPTCRSFEAWANPNAENSLGRLRVLGPADDSERSYSTSIRSPKTAVAANRKSRIPGSRCSGCFEDRLANLLDLGL